MGTQSYNYKEKDSANNLSDLRNLYFCKPPDKILSSFNTWFQFYDIWSREPVQFSAVVDFPLQYQELMNTYSFNLT